MPNSPAQLFVCHVRQSRAVGYLARWAVSSIRLLGTYLARYAVSSVRLPDTLGGIVYTFTWHVEQSRLSVYLARWTVPSIRLPGTLGSPVYPFTWHAGHSRLSAFTWHVGQVVAAQVEQPGHLVQLTDQQ